MFMTSTRPALGKARADSIQWLPAEHLGQLSVDEPVRPWLIGKGLVSERMKAVCGEGFRLKLVDQWTGLLNASHKSAGVLSGVERSSYEFAWLPAVGRA